MNSAPTAKYIGEPKPLARPAAKRKPKRKSILAGGY